MSGTATFDGALIGTGDRRLGGLYLQARARQIFDGLVALWVFSGFFVLVEPSPYEMTFVLVLVMAGFARMGLYKTTLGLLGIIALFIPFALIAAFQVRYNPITNAMVFTLVTIFLMLTSYISANYIAEHTARRMRIIIWAYTFAACLAAIIGTLAYLGIMPNAELFLRYGRAKATFKDPNVYGPFLILPAVFALQRVMLARDLRTIIISGGIYLTLFVGVFASFSRAAWGHFAVSSLIALVLVFFLEAQGRDKVRILLMTLGGGLMLMIALGGLLSIPAVGQLFETRTESQNYDSGETGRFGRQGYAFELALANPLGIGPGEFRNLRIVEEPHNVYVSVLHVYGWGGGVLFYLIIALTLWKGFRSVVVKSPYRLMAIPVFATFSIVMIESAIIDSDHWRHIYLLIGLTWGLSTAIGKDKRRRAPRDEMLV